MNKISELTKVQRSVIEAMHKGEKLYQSMTMDAHYWLSPSLQGVRRDTGYSLYRRGFLLIDIEKFPTRTYKLNPNIE